MFNFKEKLLATKASSDRNRQQDLDILKVKLEEKKMHVEWLKLAISILIPILAAVIAASIAASSINKQLATQADLKRVELDFQQKMENQKYESQKRLETLKFESQLLLEAVKRNDKDSLFYKLVSLGFLEDSTKKYSLLLYDTIYAVTPYVKDIVDKVDTLIVKKISVWDKDFMFDIFGVIQGSSPNAEIDNSGMIKFSLNVSSIQSASFRPILTLKDSSNPKDSINISMRLIDVPPSLDKTKHVVFIRYDRKIKEKFNRINSIETKWNRE